MTFYYFLFSKKLLILYLVTETLLLTKKMGEVRTARGIVTGKANRVRYAA